ncbi:retron system putative HNH endonuclease [Stenotrophomonas maltophilia]|nr:MULTISPECIES: retron system putative HNH endonuclease [Gammaproteobacteria]MBH1464648.1 TIGR02646 family protein [Stenotrophomonas maltophilia]MBH1612143.1 TIGR02646 family protein [Stenotrophomonas maltophilia]MBH1715875.1 TIGR02646 family protein [Stenotrophomonas maltophilia]MBN5167011.1 TIGR02646 family protein [Stenotrophomonas maltophilia]QGL78359.1 TIGR02646 family protein [Stenotrophomonas maltophilia]
MLELLHHLSEPVQLTNFRTTLPQKTAAEWDALAFHPVKQAVKAVLRQEQGHLCVYCEVKVATGDGHVEHIKPKAGPNAQANLCFVYSNLALSCNTKETCGSKKKAGLLPIEPGPGCNKEWSLSTDGTIEPLPDLTKARRHAVVQTRDMLGLNKSSDLVDERKRWLASAVEILKAAPNDLSAFLADAPYRTILATAF